MCHAAIVARKYGLPAVLCMGTATQRITASDLIRVDADDGVHRPSPSTLLSWMGAERLVANATTVGLSQRRAQA